jgi:hypothetical protein
MFRSDACAGNTRRDSRHTDQGTDFSFSHEAARAGRRSFRLVEKMVGAAGIEPATTGLEIRCSIRLSYAPISRQATDLARRIHAAALVLHAGFRGPCATTVS